MALLSPLQLEVWVALSITFIVSLLFLAWYLRVAQTGMSSSKSFIYLIALFFDASLPVTQRTKNVGIRCFLVLFLFGSYTLTTAYRGTLTSELTVTIPTKPVDTIKELAYEVDTPVASFATYLRQETENSTDPRFRNIAERYVTHYNYEEAFLNASRGELILAESENFLRYNIREKFTDE